MAIQIKHLVAQSLLKLCETAPLSTITIQQILDDTGISRQTFYNHFKDKYALIQYIYDAYIIPDFQLQQITTINFYEILVTSFQRMQTYHSFLKQACLMDGQKCLKTIFINIVSLLIYSGMKYYTVNSLYLKLYILRRSIMRMHLRI